MSSATPVTYRQMVSGSAWMIAMRWAMRALGMVSTIILARVLVPEDFGLVAMGTMTIALINTFSELGTSRLLIRIQKPDRSHYDTAWTIFLLQGILVAVTLYVGAPLAALYFREPRVIPITRYLALASIISGFANIGVVNFRKELRFRADFLYEFCGKASTVLVTVPLALYLRSYWALVLGAVTSEAVKVVLSYIFHPYRPRWSLVRWRDFIRFSVWVTPSNIAGFFIARADALIVGALMAASQLGLYHFASEISKMATNEIVVPIGRALYPSYAKLVADPEKLAETFLNVVRTVAIVCFALGPGLSLVAEDFVYVLLGPKWSPAVPLMRFLAITGALLSLANVLRAQIFVVTGKERFSFVLYAIQLFVSVPCLVWVGFSFGIEEIAATTVALSGVFVVIAAANVRRAVPVSFLTIMGAFARPFSAACAMVIAIRLIPLDSIDVRVLRLFLHVALGAVAYSGTLLLLWIRAGRPDGPEKGIIGAVGSVLSRFRGQRRLES